MTGPNPDHLPEGAVGVDYPCTDGSKLPTSVHHLDGPALRAWFLSHPKSSEEVSVRILALPVESTSADHRRTLSVAFDRHLVEHALWGPEIYYTLATNPAGGASAFLDEPPRFILQTPADGGPFCSLALSKRGSIVKGVYHFDDDVFKPDAIAEDEQRFSGWGQRGFQIHVLPQAILKAHSKYLSSQLASLMQTMDRIEATLVSGEDVDFGETTRSLHACSATLMVLERRSRFEKLLLSSLELLIGKSRDGNLPWSPLAAPKSAFETRAFDLDALPRRIENARATISALIQQRNEHMNLEIARASQRVAEIALSDNKSMKTIAVMTMLFLPGTAVASFFSMSMFDWGAADGDALASKWLWVYFVLAVPLTAVVMVVWWIWGRRMARRALEGPTSVGGLAMDDAEARPAHVSAFADKVDP